MRSLYTKIKNVRDFLVQSNLEEFALLSDYSFRKCICVVITTNQHYLWDLKDEQWDFLDYGDNKELIQKIHDEAIVINIIEHKINKKFVTGTEVIVSKEVLIEAFDEALSVLNL